MVAVNAHAKRRHEALQVSFGCQEDVYLKRYQDTSERRLFYYLINVDEFHAVWPRAQQLVAQYLERARVALNRPETLPDGLQAFTYTPAAFADRMATLYQQQMATPIDTPLTATQLHNVLKQYAPSALIDGCWLQNISLAATCHTEIVTRLFHIYTEKIGNGETSNHYGNLYRNLLHSAQIYLPEITARAFTTRDDLSDSAFTTPVFQLALSLFPRLRLPELIGFTLGHFFHPQDRLLTTLVGELKRHGCDDRYCQRYVLADQPGEAAQLAQEVVTLYLDDVEDETERQQHWQRIWTGLVVHTVITERWRWELRHELTAPKTLTPHENMLALVRRKAPYARHMHRQRTLGGRLINDWFAAEPFDAEGFLAALAASPYIDLERPPQSSLLTQLIGFGGPMFRIFTAEEQAVMAAWIQSLASAPPPRESADTDSGPPSVASQAPQMRVDDDKGQAELAAYAKCNKRELYYYFVNADLYPDVLPTARKVAEQYFKRAKAQMAKRRLPAHLQWFPYHHDTFEVRIRQIYDLQTSAYQPFESSAVMPKEAMIWFAQQYAPFPMVDGAWLQHIAKAGMSQTDIATRLFRIYSDEIGNADTFRNHPNVYRRLLESVGLDMPPTDSLAFAMQPGLLDFAFDIPLLTLSVSMFPKTFLSELIGVNLAIELSGLGQDYMTIIDMLNHWKIDPYFFTLHLTIDNIASGHTAISIETVQLYLDQVLTTHGQQAMQREWERVWIGYLACERTMKRFDATLLRKASLRFIVPFLRLKLRGKLPST